MPPQFQPRLRAQSLDIFLISLSLMMFEINLVRLFSVIMWYHLAFFVFSIALFGFGIGGLYSQILRSLRKQDKGPPRFLYFLPIALSASIVISFLLLALLPMNEESVSFQVPRLRWMLAAFLLAATPFFFGSMFMELTFASRPADAARLYFYDLLGAALGCLCAVAALQWLGGLNAPFLIAILAALPALRGGFPSERTRRFVAAMVMLIVAVLGLLNLSVDYVNKIAASSLLGRTNLFSAWNFYSQITVKPAPWWRGWVLSDRYDGPIPEHLMIAQDSRAPAFAVKYNGDNHAVRYLRYDITSMPYRVFSPKSAMIIGTGGGRDVLTAKIYGVEKVKGLELNSIIANDVMRERFKEFSGGVYELPGVDVVVESGRTFAHHTEERFDLTLISYADSQSSNSQGASVLSENHLYTQEAWQSYWNVLTEDGVATAAVNAFWGNHMLPRMLNTMRAALEAEGVEHPERHILAVVTPTFEDRNAGVFAAMSRQPITEEDVQRAQAAAEELNYQVVWPQVPGNADSANIAQLFEPESRAAFLAAHPYDLTPLVDDRPYLCYGIKPATFFSLLLNPFSEAGTYPVQLRTLHLLVGLFLIAFVSVLVLMISPLIIFSRKELRNREAKQPTILFIFFLLGIGFVMYELALLQEFFLLLGDPTLSFAVTLAAMLAFTGFGSFLSSRFRAEHLRRRIATIAVVVLVVQTIVALALPSLVYGFLSAPLLTRCAVVFGLLAVVATPMGMLFPSTIRLLDHRGVDMTCWAWGMNGVGSVLGSVGTTLVSMNLGIKTVFIVAIACYALVALSSLRLGEDAPVPQPAKKPRKKKAVAS